MLSMKREQGKKVMTDVLIMFVLGEIPHRPPFALGVALNGENTRVREKKPLPEVRSPKVKGDISSKAFAKNATGKQSCGR